MNSELQLELPLLGKLPQNWNVVEFGSVLDGGTRNGIYKQKEFHGTGDKIVNMGELFAYPRLFAVPMKRVELSDQEKKKFRLQVGDLLFARRSLVAEGAGKCSIVCELNEPTTFESSIIRAHPNSQIVDSLYLYFLFRSPYGAYILGTIRRQVAVSGITGTDLVKLLIPLPPLSEQKAIAQILSSLDDKIELNKQMNETLEAMARAMFKSWFVDFDPVRAKMEGRQPAGMDAATADLFPDELEKSSLGLIPKGWKISTLKKVAERITKGTTPTTLKKRFVESGINFLKVQSITNDGFFIPEQLAYIDNETHQLLSRSSLKENDILYSIAGTIGRVAIVDQSILPANTNQAVAIIRPNTAYIEPLYLRYLLQHNIFQQELSANVVHAVQANLSLTSIGNLEFILPNIAIQNNLLRSFKSLHCQVLANVQQSRTLTTIRDALLPKLMSGEIRVNEAEKLLEAVA